MRRSKEEANLDVVCNYSAEINVIPALDVVVSLSNIILT